MTVAAKKAAAGYQAKPVFPTCSNCQHFSSTRMLPDWMRECNEELKDSGVTERYTLFKHGLEKDIHCKLHLFAVKKTATCKMHMPKDSQ